MTTSSTQAQANDDNAVDEAPERPGSESGAENAAAKPDTDAQLKEMKDQLLRALADAENTRRRAQKEREETSKYAVSNFARDMLNVADNFQRALDAMPADSVSDPAVKNLITGIEATNRQLQATMDRFGVKKMEPMGQPFDPNFHRVMMEVDDANAAPGTIVQVLQPGYVIHDRLLREALVAVSKGTTSGQPKVDQSA